MVLVFNANNNSVMIQRVQGVLSVGQYVMRCSIKRKEMREEEGGGV